MATKLYETDIGNRKVEVYKTENPVDLSRMILDDSINQIFGLDIKSGISVDSVKQELRTMGHSGVFVSPRKDEEGREFICIRKY